MKEWPLYKIKDTVRVSYSLSYDISLKILDMWRNIAHRYLAVETKLEKDRMSGELKKVRQIDVFIKLW